MRDGRVTIQSVGDRGISRAPLATGNDLMLFGIYSSLARHYARVASVLVRECRNIKTKKRRRHNENVYGFMVALGCLVKCDRFL